MKANICTALLVAFALFMCLFLPIYAGIKGNNFKELCEENNGITIRAGKSGFECIKSDSYIDLRGK